LPPDGFPQSFADIYAKGNPFYSRRDLLARGRKDALSSKGLQPLLLLQQRDISRFFAKWY